MKLTFSIGFLFLSQKVEALESFWSCIFQALVLGLLLYEWDLAHGAPSKTSIVEGQEG